MKIKIIFVLTAIFMSGCGGGGSGGGKAQSSVSQSQSSSAAHRFTEISGETGISFIKGYKRLNATMPEGFGGGVASGDYDNDGDIDLFVVRGDLGSNLLYRNDGNNKFVDVASAAGLAFTKSATENYRHCGPVIVDVNGDGYLDLFLGAIEGDPVQLFLNNKDGTFKNISAAAGLSGLSSKYTISAAFADYDLDGDLDMALSHWGSYRPKNMSGDRGDTETLWRNDMVGDEPVFVSVSVSSKVAPSILNAIGGYFAYTNPSDYDYSFTPSFARLNDDLYPDLLVVSDFSNTRVFLNNGMTENTFSDATDSSVITDRNGMGSAVGDLDNDGDLDWFVTGIWGASEIVGNRLYLNQGAGTFSDATLSAGVQDGGWGWGTCMADFDLDGQLDIFHTNGWTNSGPSDAFASDPSRLFMSDGGGHFTNRAVQLGLIEAAQGRGVVCADFDGDGDIDIFTTKSGTRNDFSFWRNDLSGKKSFKVKLKGSGKNSEAAGARIKITIDGITQMREVMIGNNFTSHNPTEQIFGLNTANKIEKVRIEWPDGSTNELMDVDAGNRIINQE